MDKIDPAMLRPGRLEHAFNVGVPNLQGRKEIWEIHTKNLVKNGILDASIIPILAQ
jgi:ATP-dependent 26S proteasome regulatory subunit